ncbi:MAG: right-handed parallel beta-helix repeat-containing protein [Aquabacterium sp.]|uniref:right-handed parallel beta-helix repeat-containing protein n=1 Tax=Aquabacterium sp. TaxID=1872578 RepID=UPI0025C69328|nr:right-handed parallel beta-helix repeat-containing protein [Aquabacterium sp.]MBI3382752.1 right-handed parallel beta-helix repeat-containing protein [Aquabacterium sp.]
MAGDTVRIFYSATPYRGHILLAANGTASAPVRVCGVKGTNGERPIIDGQNAVARKGLAYTGASSGNIQETRALIMVDRLNTQSWSAAYPTYIQIDGLELRNAKPGYTFTNSLGGVQAYDSFGACLWVERGANITIADNVIHDCTNGIYTRSVDVGAGMSTITQDIRIAGNYIYSNGAANDMFLHNIYAESLRITYEFNRLGPLVPTSQGIGIKDRSLGTVIRYNHITEGAHSMDLVEPEDWSATAATFSQYAPTYVYGNVIVKNGDTGSPIHYGGDHMGSEASDHQRRRRGHLAAYAQRRGSWLDNGWHHQPGQELHPFDLGPG